MVYDSLTFLDASGDVHPSLAESFTLDGTTWEFKLREGVKFHDGSDLTAEDVVWSFKRATDQDLPIARELPQAEPRAVDDFTVQFSSPEINAFMPAEMAQFFILPKAYFESVGIEKFVEDPIGSGPYKYLEIQGGVGWEVELLPSSHAFRDPIPQGIKATIIGEPSTVAAGLRTEILDIAHSPIEPDTLRTMENSGFTVHAVPVRTVTHFYDTWRHCRDNGPLCSSQVRKALIYATDGATISETIWQGFAEAIPAPALPDSLGYPGNLPIPFDPAKAEELLDSAGYPRGSDGTRFELTYRVWQKGPVESMAFALQDMWADVGVKVDTGVMELGTFVDHLFRRKGLEHLDIMGLLAVDTFNNNLDQFKNLGPWEEPGGITVPYDNPEFFQKKSELIRTVDTQKQRQIIEELTTMLSAQQGDPPYFYLNAIPEVFVTQAYVKGFEAIGGRSDVHWENLRRVA